MKKLSSLIKMELLQVIIQVHGCSQKTGPYVTIVAGGVVYQGVFIKQKIEGTAYETMCFTTVGNNNVTFWGTKGYTDEAIVIKDAGMMKDNCS